MLLGVSDWFLFPRMKVCETMLMALVYGPDVDDWFFYGVRFLDGDEQHTNVEFVRITEHAAPAIDEQQHYAIDVAWNSHPQEKIDAVQTLLAALHSGPPDAEGNNPNEGLTVSVEAPRIGISNWLEAHIAQGAPPA
jgi:hypothetical protein